MKIGILSDIHGNFHALQAVEEDMTQEQIEKVWCLGDIINYGAFPNECCLWITKNCSQVILGNHELMLLELAEVDSATVNECLIWTKKVIDSEFIKFFKKCSLIQIVKNTTLVHDNPTAPGSATYITDTTTATAYLLKPGTDICFFGHTHISIGYRLSSIGAEVIRKTPFKVNNGRFLINPGSVGQPRDRNPSASYLIYDTKNRSVKTKRVSYNTQAAAKSIIEAGLPPIMAARILKGV